MNQRPLFPLGPSTPRPRASGSLGVLALCVSSACAAGADPDVAQGPVLELQREGAALPAPRTSEVKPTRSDSDDPPSEFFSISGSWRWQFAAKKKKEKSKDVLPTEEISLNFEKVTTDPRDPSNTVQTTSTESIWTLKSSLDARGGLTTRFLDGRNQAVCTFASNKLVDARGNTLLEVSAEGVEKPGSREPDWTFEGDEVFAGPPGEGCALVWASVDFGTESDLHKIALGALLEGLCGAPLAPPTELQCPDLPPTGCELSDPNPTGGMKACPASGQMPDGLDIAPPLMKVAEGDGAMFRYVAGVSGSKFDAFRDENQALGFAPLTTSAFSIPLGSTRHSGIAVRDLNVTDSRVYRKLTQAERDAKIQDLAVQGYRLVDLEADSNGQAVYQATFRKEKNPPLWGVLDGSAAAVQAKLTELEQYGYRPLRLDGYRSGNSVRHTSVLVRDSVGSDFRVYFGLTSGEYSQAFSQADADGYSATDLDVYRTPQGALRLDAIFTADSTVKGFATSRELTQNEFLAKHETRTLEGYKLVDVEVYGDSIDAAARYAGIWHRSETNRLRSNLSLTNGLSQSEETALNQLNAAIDLFNDAGHELGFMVEDLTTGNRLTYNPDRPFYLASTSKVIIAGYVLSLIDKGSLFPNQQIQLGSEDLLEVGDLPDSAGAYSVDQLLKWMLNSSSTDATDALVKLVGQAALDAWVAETINVESLHEITSMCELDRRIVSYDVPCAAQVTCKELENVVRNGQQPTTECNLPSEGVISDDAYRAYYTTLANTATPRAYAQVWHRLLDPTVLSTDMRGYLMAIMDATNDGTDAVLCAPSGGVCSAPMATTYNDMAMKNGAKRWITSWVAVPHVESGQGLNQTRDPQYSISFFTSREPTSTTSSSDSDQVIQDAAAAAVAFLQAKRP